MPSDLSELYVDHHFIVRFEADHFIILRGEKSENVEGPTEYYTDKQRF